MGVLGTDDPAPPSPLRAVESERWAALPSFLDCLSNVGTIFLDLTMGGLLSERWAE